MCSLSPLYDDSPHKNTAVSIWRRPCHWLQCEISLLGCNEAVLVSFYLLDNLSFDTNIDKSGSPIGCNGEQISNISPVKVVVVSILAKKKNDSV